MGMGGEREAGMEWKYLLGGRQSQVFIEDTGHSLVSAFQVRGSRCGGSFVGSMGLDKNREGSMVSEGLQGMKSGCAP